MDNKNKISSDSDHVNKRPEDNNIESENKLDKDTSSPAKNSCPDNIDEFKVQTDDDLFIMRSDDVTDNPYDGASTGQNQLSIDKNEESDKSDVTNDNSNKQNTVDERETKDTSDNTGNRSTTNDEQVSGLHDKSHTEKEHENIESDGKDKGLQNSNEKIVIDNTFEQKQSIVRKDSVKSGQSENDDTFDNQNKQVETESKPATFDTSKSKNENENCLIEGSSDSLSTKQRDTLNEKVVPQEAKLYSDDELTATKKEFKSEPSPAKSGKQKADTEESPVANSRQKPGNEFQWEKYDEEKISNDDGKNDNDKTGYGDDKDRESDASDDHDDEIDKVTKENAVHHSDDNNDYANDYRRDDYTKDNISDEHRRNERNEDDKDYRRDDYKSDAYSEDDKDLNNSESKQLTARSEESKHVVIAPDVRVNSGKSQNNQTSNKSQKSPRKSPRPDDYQTRARNTPTPSQVYKKKQDERKFRRPAHSAPVKTQQLTNRPKSDGRRCISRGE